MKISATFSRVKERLPDAKSFGNPGKEKGKNLFENSPEGDQPVNPVEISFYNHPIPTR